MINLNLIQTVISLFTKVIPSEALIKRVERDLKEYDAWINAQLDMEDSGFIPTRTYRDL